VITDLYRRNVWSDARTVNLVADACKHPAPRILVAALKFFLGQDEAAEAAAAGGDDESDDDEDKPKVGQGTKAGTASGVSKEDVYKAYNKVRRAHIHTLNPFFISFGFFLPLLRRCPRGGGTVGPSLSFSLSLCQSLTHTHETNVGR
jgi:hypothetical protein